MITLTHNKLSCTFHKLKPLVAGVAPSLPATACSRTMEIVAGTVAVTPV